MSCWPSVRCLPKSRWRMQVQIKVQGQQNTTTPKMMALLAQLRQDILSAPVSACVKGMLGLDVLSKKDVGDSEVSLLLATALQKRGVLPECVSGVIDEAEAFQKVTTVVGRIKGGKQVTVIGLCWAVTADVREGHEERLVEYFQLTVRTLIPDMPPH